MPTRGPDRGDLPTIELAGEEFCPNTSFHERTTKSVWFLKTWNQWTVTLVDWENKDHAIYDVEAFERAIADGQFEKVGDTLDRQTN